MLIPLILYFVCFFLSFYYDFDFNGFLILLASIFLLYKLSFKNINFLEILFFSFILGFLGIFWIYFIVDYIGLFFTILSYLLCALVLGSLLFLKFVPFKWFNFNDELNKFYKFSKSFFIFAIFYSFYFVLWEYLFYSFDSLSLSFFQFYFTVSKTFIFYPLFSLNPYLVVFLFLIISFLGVFLLRRYNFKVFLVFFLVLLSIELFVRFYYFFLIRDKVFAFESKLKKKDIVLFFISTDTVALAPDYRLRNENMTFYKLIVGLYSALNFGEDKSFYFFLPEGSLSKDNRYLFYLFDHNVSSSVFNLRKNILELVGNEKIYNIFNNSYIFFNPTVVDSKSNLYNGVVMLNLYDIFRLRVEEYSFYNKRFLVSFVEKTPRFFIVFSNYLSRWIEVFRYQDYSEGLEEEKLFYLKSKLHLKSKLQTNYVSFIPLICFESFKFIPRKMKDSDFIVLSSNDRWFIGERMMNPMYYLHLKSVKVLSISKKRPIFLVLNGSNNKIFYFEDVTKLLKESKLFILY